MELDGIVRELARPIILRNNLDVDDLNPLEGSFAFGDYLIKFEVNDMGFGDVIGNELEEMMEQTVHQRILVVMTARWMAVVKQEGRFYIYNCHSTKNDGSPDFADVEPAVVFLTESAAEAAKFLKQFGCAEDMPLGRFSCHSVTMSLIH